MIRVCSVSDIQENSMNKFVIGKKEILVGKKNGKLFACENSCPHRGASLHRGSYNDDNLIVCYMHDYEFDINSGKLINMKSWKKSDTWIEQNYSWRKSGDLVMYGIKIKNDTIYVKINPNQ